MDNFILKKKDNIFENLNFIYSLFVNINFYKNQFSMPNCEMGRWLNLEVIQRIILYLLFLNLKTVLWRKQLTGGIILKHLKMFHIWQHIGVFAEGNSLFYREEKRLHKNQARPNYEVKRGIRTSSFCLIKEKSLAKIYTTISIFRERETLVKVDKRWNSNGGERHTTSERYTWRQRVLRQESATVQKYTCEKVYTIWHDFSR